MIRSGADLIMYKQATYDMTMLSGDLAIKAQRTHFIAVEKPLTYTILLVNWQWI